MKKTLPFLGALALSACMSPMGETSSSAAMVGPISTAEAFQSEIVGKTLTIGDASLVIAGDGTLEGNFNNAPLKGTWEFVDGQFCRTLTEHQTQAATFDCQNFVKTAPNVVTVNRDDGRSFDYTIS